MEIKESTLLELQNELVINYRDLTSDILLLECLIQCKRELFSINGKYYSEEYDLTVYRIASYIEQHSKEIITISKAIKINLIKDDVYLDSKDRTEIKV